MPIPDGPSRPRRVHLRKAPGYCRALCEPHLSTRASTAAVTLWLAEAAESSRAFARVSTQCAASVPSSLGLRETGITQSLTCLLYTSDAADEEDSVDLGGRR